MHDLEIQYLICIKFQKSLFMCISTKFYKFMHDIVNNIQHHAMIFTMLCMELVELGVGAHEFTQFH